MEGDECGVFKGPVEGGCKSGTQISCSSGVEDPHEFTVTGPISSLLHEVTAMSHKP